MTARRGLNQTEVAILLSLHRAGASTRTRLARALGFGSATVFRASESLITGEWVVETSRAPSSAGRRARPIAIAPTAGYVLAFNLSAERSDVAIVGADLRIAGATSVEMDLHRHGPEPVFERLAATAVDVARRLHLKDSPAGVGIAIAGLVETAPGTPVMPSGLALWHGYHLGTLAAEVWDVPIVIDNDANLCALGEMFRGAGRDCRNFMYVHLDIGIGAGLVIERQLYRGSSGFAGEIGHIRVSGVSRQCPCGKIGCLQSVASVPAVLATARGRGRATKSAEGQASITIASLGAAAAAGDESAIGLVSETGSRIGQVLGGVCSVVSPDKILVGGRLAGLGPRLLTSIRRSLTEEGLAGTGHRVSIEPAELGDHAALMGAAALAMERVIVDSAASVTPSPAEKLANHPIASLVV